MNQLHETMIERARALLPVLRERAPRTLAERQISVETIQDFHQAGFWKLLQPARYGGLEAHPNTLFEVQATIARRSPVL